MAYRFISPVNSFVRFGESSVTESCNFGDIQQCLPVLDDDDVAFQFVVEADTEEEADALCSITSPGVSIGLARSCSEPNIVNFDEVPDRYRISPLQVLYNWSHGFPGFTALFAVGECFVLRATLEDESTGCTNCFQRISSGCHTSVIEYGNDDNAFGFSYCAGGAIDNGGGGVETDCAPTYVSFINQSTMAIPYTAAMTAKYGVVPNVKAWIYNPDGELQNISVVVTFDAYPVTMVNVDLGGPATGVIKIS